MFPSYKCTWNTDNTKLFSEGYRVLNYYMPSFQEGIRGAFQWGIQMCPFQRGRIRGALLVVAIKGTYIKKEVHFGSVLGFTASDQYQFTLQISQLI